VRKFVVVFFVLALMLGGVSTSAHAYVAPCYKDTLINKTGDWFATFGKKGMAKKQILTKRKYDRVVACTSKKRA